jgi:superfamily II DNA or RNA helicase
MELRPYQQAAIAASAEAEARGVTRQLIVWATGLGKTVAISALVAGKGTPRTFGFMHRDELIQQSIEKLKIFNPAARIGVEKAELRADPDKDNIVLASVQSVGRSDRARISRFDPDWPQLVWLDEAHHAVADTFLNVLDHFGLHGESPRRDRLLIGTTATPDRLDEMGFDKIFDDVVHRYGLREAIRDAWLADIRAWRRKSDLDLAGVRTVKGEFVEKDLAEAIDASRMKQVAVETWEERCRGRRSLFFCVTKAHAHEIAEAIKARGGKVAVVVDDTPKADRRAAIELFKSGDLDALTGVSVFTEGFDAPETECIHIIRPTRSRALYTQIIGRGTRRTPTKSFVELYDYTDQVHDVCSIGQIFGLPDSWALNGQSVPEEADKVEEIEADLGLKAEGTKGMQELIGRIHERRIELIRGTLADSGLPSRLAWIKPSQAKERWFISWRNETKNGLGRVPPSVREEAEDVIADMNLWGVYERIEVFRNELGRYEAKLHRSGPGDSNTKGGRLDSDHSLVKLVSRLDKLILDRRPHKEKLLRKNAPWTRQPASDKQKEVLLRKGVPPSIATGLTKGEAYSLINMPGAVIKKWFDGVEKA